MNAVEHVMLVTDTNLVPVKFSVLATNIGSTLANSNVWIRCIGYGIATEEDLKSLKLTANQSLYIGTLGSYQVVDLTKIKPYTRKSGFDTGYLTQPAG